MLAQRRAKWRARHLLRSLEGVGGADLCGLGGLDFWDSCDPGRRARAVVADAGASADPQHTCVSLVAITAIGPWLLSGALGCAQRSAKRLARDLVGFLVGKVGTSRKCVEVLVVGKWGLRRAWAALCLGRTVDTELFVNLAGLLSHTGI